MHLLKPGRKKEGGYSLTTRNRKRECNLYNRISQIPNLITFQLNLTLYNTMYKQCLGIETEVLVTAGRGLAMLELHLFDETRSGVHLNPTSFQLVDLVVMGPI